MPKIEIVALGKDKDAWVTEGCGHYVKLLSRYVETKLTYAPTIKQGASLTPCEIMAREAELLRRNVGKGTVVALSEKGKRMNSPSLARFIEKLQISSSGKIIFVIGGSHGLDTGLIRQADNVISLSEMTFSHQLVRVILLEQLYRAFSILNGGSYHK